MHRSPGVFFDHDKGKTHASGKLLFNCRIIPGRGSWLDFEYDPKDILYFRIDRKKKLPISTILLALGLDKQKIINTFYNTSQYKFDYENKMWIADFNPNEYKRPVKLSYDLLDAKSSKKILSKGEKLNIVIAKKLKEKGLNSISVANEQIIGKYIGKDVKEKNDEILIGAGFDITEEQLEKIIAQEEKELSKSNNISLKTKTNKVFDIPNTAFFPAPKVKSSVVQLIPYEKPLFDVNFESVEKITQMAFSQRRKMLKSSLKEINGKKILADLSISPNLRPEDLSVLDFCRIAKMAFEN